MESNESELCTVVEELAESEAIERNKCRDLFRRGGARARSIR